MAEQMRIFLKMPGKGKDVEPIYVSREDTIRLVRADHDLTNVRLRRSQRYLRDADTIGELGIKPDEIL